MNKIYLLIAFFSLVTLLFANDLNSDFVTKIPMGVRAAGMGNAFTSISGDATCAFWNPAGLATVKNMELTSSRAKRYDLDLYNNYINYLYPLKKYGTLGFSYYDSSIDGVMILGSDPSAMSYGSDTQRVLSFNYGYKASKQILVGFNLKHLSETATNTDANGFEGDIGFIYKGKKYIDFGMSINDCLPTDFSWSTGKSEKIPATFRMGIQYHSPLETFRAAFDTEFTKSQDTVYRLGSEYKLNDFLTIRGGYEYLGAGGNASLGFSVKYSDWTFDYSWNDHDLGVSSMLAATLKFGAPKKKKAEITRNNELIGSELNEIKSSAVKQKNYNKKMKSTLNDVMSRYQRPKYTYDADNSKPKKSQITPISEDDLSDEAKNEFDLGNVYLLKKMYNKAIEQYLNVIKIAPQFSKVHFNLGAIYQKIGMEEKAIYEYRIVLKLTPNNVNALLALGNLYLQKGVSEKAVVYYNRIIIQAPDSIQADVARKRLANL
jgi:tetratricopeptide (TPR) repeat protein